MRILIHTKASLYGNSLSGGAESSLKLLAEKLADQGHDVYYLAKGNHKYPSLQMRSINGVNVYLFSPISWPSKISASLARIKQQWIRKQFAYIIGKVIKRHDVQIVHSFNEFPTTYDILKIRRNHNHFKSALRIAGLHWYERCKASPDLIPRIEWVFNNVDLLAFISKGVERLFEEHTERLGMKIKNQSRRVLEIGTDEQLFSNKWVNSNTNNKKMVMVGRMAYPKRQDLLIEALRLLDNPKIELHFFGDGPDRSRLMELVEKYQLQARVHFHGFVSQEKISVFLQGVDLFCHASEYEGLCKSVIEAMRIGSPALVSDVMSLNSYVQNGINGYLTINEADSWAKMIDDLLFGNKDLETISKNEIQFAMDKYNSNNNVNAYVDAFRSLVHK